MTLRPWMEYADWRNALSLSTELGFMALNNYKKRKHLHAMPAFEIYLNGKKVSTAGVGELGVLSASATWVRRKGENTRAKRPDAVEEELTLNVSALDTITNEHLQWLNRKLKVEDEILHTDCGKMSQSIHRAIATVEILWRN